MKITYSPAGTSNVYVIEGDATEMETVISRIISTAKPSNNNINRPLVKKPTVNVTPDNDKLKAFLDSVYLYPANPANDTGKGRYIAQILADFKPHTLAEIVAGTDIIAKTVHKNIAKMRAAGATISVNGTTITLVEIPNKRFIKKRRATNKSKTTVVPSKIKKTSKNPAELTAVNALKGFKLS